MTFTELLAKIFERTTHKSVTISPDSGMTFTGYSSDEVLDMIQSLKDGAADAAHWTGASE